jgi:hypothetical protein
MIPDTVGKVCGAERKAIPTDAPPTGCHRLLGASAGGVAQPATRADAGIPHVERELRKITDQRMFPLTIAGLVGAIRALSS